MLRGKRIIVSGGAGVIGTVLVGKLRAAGAEVWVGDLKPRPAHFDASVVYRQGDLNDVTAEELLDFEPDIFLHLAATFERSTETPEFWDENFHHNVLLSSYLCGLLRKSTTLRKIVFASSYLVYDPALYLFDRPQTLGRSLIETDRVTPRNLCGAAKYYHEHELRFLGQVMEHCQIVYARIFRGYGIGSRDVISRWVRELLCGRPIDVFRTEGMFDFTYGEDTAEALLRLAASDAQGAINVGTGRSRRVSDVLAVLGKHFPGMSVREVPSDIAFEASQADVSRLEAVTGWRPQLHLEDTIPRIVQHERRVLESSAVVGGRSEAASAPPRGNVLLTSVSRKVPLVKAVRAALRDLQWPVRTLGADVDGNCIARRFVDDFWLMPRLDDLPLATLIDECRRRDVAFIIPSRDGELEYFAKHRGGLGKAGITVMISQPEAVRICRDKLEFSRHLRSRSFPAIPASVDLSEVDATRLVVKERYGAGASGIALDVNAGGARTHAAGLSQPIFQPFINGTEFSVDVFIGRSGKSIGAVARRRDVIIGGESQITTSVRHQRAEELCAVVAEDLGIYGHVVFQVLEDEAGALHIIECNPRFGGASSLSIAVGLQSFRWFLLETLGERLDHTAFVRAATERQQIRYPSDLIVAL